MEAVGAALRAMYPQNYSSIITVIIDRNKLPCCLCEQVFPGFVSVGGTS